jgi:predicted metal-dependent hydrolase
LEAFEEAKEQIKKKHEEYSRTLEKEYEKLKDELIKKLKTASEK